MSAEAEIRQKIDHLKRLGAIEVHPDDVDKPWEEQRLRRTELGDWLMDETPRRRPSMAMSEVVREGLFYVGTYFQGEYGDASLPREKQSPKCTLLVRHIKLLRTPKGKLQTKIDTDALEFPDADAMIEVIRERRMRELPAEADGNPRYLPVGFRPGEPLSRWRVRSKAIDEIVEAADQFEAWDTLRDRPVEDFGVVVSAERDENADPIAIRTSALMAWWKREDDFEAAIAATVQAGLPDTTEQDWGFSPPPLAEVAA